MNYFYGQKSFNSIFNGDIKIRRLFGIFKVIIHDLDYNSKYLDSMWRHVFKKTLKQDLEHKRDILMIGLGAGQQIRLINEYFRHCYITAIEIDPSIISVAKEMSLYKPYIFPEVLIGDVNVILPSIQSKFDLILLDIFDFTIPHQQIELITKSLIPDINRVMKKDCTCIFNVIHNQPFLFNTDNNAFCNIQYQKNNIVIMTKI